MNVLAVHLDFQHLGFEALAAALVAGNEDVGHEDHLDLEIAGSLTTLAASSGNVEAEGARGIAPLPREWPIREDATSLVERLDVRDRMRARRFSNRALVDHHDVVDRLIASEGAERPDRLSEVALGAVLTVKPQLQRAHQHIVDEGALTGTRYSRNAADGT